MKNSPNSNLNNNNIIITINNYNKITPTKIVETTSIHEKKDEIKILNLKKNKKIQNKELQNQNHQNIYNYFINRHNYSLDNGKNNIYINNIFYNEVIFNKNEHNVINTIEDNYLDNLSINTCNTLNRSNNIIHSNNNTTNREYNNKN